MDEQGNFTARLLRKPAIKVKLDPRAMPFKPPKRPSDDEGEELPDLADLVLKYKLGAL